MTHDEKLQEIPDCLERLKTISIIGLLEKIFDYSFNDVIGSSHPRVKGLDTRISNLF